MSRDKAEEAEEVGVVEKVVVGWVEEERKREVVGWEEVGRAKVVLDWVEVGRAKVVVAGWVEEVVGGGLGK